MTLRDLSDIDGADARALLQQLIDAHPRRKVVALIVVAAFQDEHGRGVTISDRCLVPTHVPPQQLLLEDALAHIEGKTKPIDVGDR